MADLRVTIFTDRDGDELSIVPRDPRRPDADPVISITHASTTLSVVFSDEEAHEILNALIGHLAPDLIIDPAVWGRAQSRDPEAEPVSTEGWAWPANARKAHYYNADRRSLCGKWALPFWGGGFDPDEKPSKDDCAGCRKALDKRKAKAT